MLHQTLVCIYNMLAYAAHMRQEEPSILAVCLHQRSLNRSAAQARLLVTQHTQFGFPLLARVQCGLHKLGADVTNCVTLRTLKGLGVDPYPAAAARLLLCGLLLLELCLNELRLGHWARRQHAGAAVGADHNLG